MKPLFSVFAVSRASPAFLGLVAALALAACQTMPPANPAAVPAVLAPLFGPCEPADGASSLSIFKDGGIVGNLDLVWKAAERGPFIFEAQTALGTTVVNGSITPVPGNGDDPVTYHVAVNGPGAAKLPKIGVQRSGFFTVDDEFVAIKPYELKCMLGFRLPRTWLALVADVTVDKKITRLELADTGRTIVIEVKNAANGGDAVCAKISWSRYLFFHPMLKWCQSRRPGKGADPAPVRPAATLSGIEDFSLKWVSADE